MTLTIKILIGVLIATIIGIAAFQMLDPSMQTALNTLTTLHDVTRITVSIEGEVKTKGTYMVEPGSTLDDLIQLANGLTSNADLLCFNTSHVVETDMTYYIAPINDTNDICGNDALVKVNINAAAVEDLKTLPSVGETLAASIVSYRQEVSIFNCLEDILKVKGIGNSYFSKMKNNIRLKDYI